MIKQRSTNYAGLMALVQINRGNKYEAWAAYVARTAFVLLGASLLLADKNDDNSVWLPIGGVSLAVGFGLFIFLAKRGHDRQRQSTGTNRPKRGFFTSVVLYIFLPCAIITGAILLLSYVLGVWPPK